jgi:hypothetical protein
MLTDGKHCRTLYTVKFTSLSDGITTDVICNLKEEYEVNNTTLNCVLLDKPQKIYMVGDTFNKVDTLFIIVMIMFSLFIYSFIITLFVVQCMIPYCAELKTGEKIKNSVSPVSWDEVLY